MNRAGLGLIVASALLAGTGLGFLLARDEAPAVGGKEAAATPPGEREVLYWYDPMAPQQRFEQPGKSPYMDMDLVPRFADEDGGAGVRVDAGLQQSLGLRLARVELDSPASSVVAPATLQWSTDGEHRLSARVESRVERLHVRTSFARVRRGDPLATLFAPALAGALAEYRALAAGRSSQSRQLADAARARLAQWGVAPSDVASTAGPLRIVLRAPIDGVVSEILVRDGETVMAGQAMFRLNAPDPLWAEARVPQAQATGLRAGQAVEVRMDQGSVQSRILAVLPEVDPVTRSQGVRIAVPNADGLLPAGLLVEAHFELPPGPPRPWLASEAVILTGQGARVIVRGDDGRFLPVAVTPGRQVGERMEILQGLVGGEQVVVSGQFLIDSEASLAGLLSRLDAPDAAAEAAADVHAAPAAEHVHAGPEAPERRILYWYDPMVPDKHFDAPGKSPFMDMPLVPRYEGEDEDESKGEATEPQP
jgi:Cu(I)/Ag(I) efflux system membrane fusion protein